MRSSCGFQAGLAAFVIIGAALFGGNVLAQGMSSPGGYHGFFPGMSERQERKFMKDQIRMGAKTFHWSSASGTTIIMGTGDDVLDGEIASALDGGPIPSEAPGDIQSQIERVQKAKEEEKAQEEARIDASFWAQVAEAKARMEAGLSYNRGLESAFDELDRSRQALAPASKPLSRPRADPSGPIYPEGSRKDACSITPALRLYTKASRACFLTGQINVTLLEAYYGEPLVCLSILTRKKQGSGNGIVDSTGARAFELRVLVLRPSEDGSWKTVHVQSRLRNGYQYGECSYGERGKSIEEASCSYRGSASHYMLNRTNAQRPFFMFNQKQEGALYHIEVWHRGKVIGIKEGRIGTGAISAPCKDWFVPGRNEQFIQYVK